MPIDENINMDHGVHIEPQEPARTQGAEYVFRRYVTGIDPFEPQIFRSYPTNAFGGSPNISDPSVSPTNNLDGPELRPPDDELATFINSLSSNQDINTEPPYDPVCELEAAASRRSSSKKVSRRRPNLTQKENAEEFLYSIEGVKLAEFWKALIPSKKDLNEKLSSVSPKQKSILPDKVNKGDLILLCRSFNGIPAQFNGKIFKVTNVSRGNPGTRYPEFDAICIEPGEFEHDSFHFYPEKGYDGESGDVYEVITHDSYIEYLGRKIEEKQKEIEYLNNEIKFHQQYNGREDIAKAEIAAIMGNTTMSLETKIQLINKLTTLL